MRGIAMFDEKTALTPEQYRKGKLLLDHLKELPEAEAVDLLRKTVVFSAYMAVTAYKMELKEDHRSN